jgi:hypothetical protein
MDAVCLARSRQVTDQATSFGPAGTQQEAGSPDRDAHPSRPEMRFGARRVRVHNDSMVKEKS